MKKVEGINSDKWLEYSVLSAAWICCIPVSASANQLEE